MSKLKKTLQELESALSKHRVGFLLTRFDTDSSNHDDLDILVPSELFDTAIEALKFKGYKSFSHDKALGGRRKGFQINLVKIGRIKIDLHKDFTWRKQKYIDTSLLWKTSKEISIEGIKLKVPNEILDIFLIIINIIFEKTYFLNEFKRIKKYATEVRKNKHVIVQSKKYGFDKSLSMFFNWLENKEESKKPIFLPPSLVMTSYVEKLLYDRTFDPVSFAYYLFFRIRYVLKAKLPYN